MSNVPVFEKTYPLYELCRAWWIVTDVQAQLERNIVYNYLPELEAYRRKMGNNRDHDFRSLQHIDFFIDYMRKCYATTSSRLVPLLENGETTYDLLWALFRPNTILYTTCNGADKPRCVFLDYGGEIVAHDGTRHYSLMCRYLDFDGDALGEVVANITIEKFRGTRCISTLKAFPLDLHPNKRAMRARLITQGRKFLSLMGPHHCHCQGAAFTRDSKNQIKKFSVNGRIMVDAEFFRKMNPNYPRPCVGKRMNTTAARLELDSFANAVSTGTSRTQPSGPIEMISVGPATMEETDLLICCPTVPGFSLNEKVWGESSPLGVSKL